MGSDTNPDAFMSISFPAAPHPQTPRLGHPDSGIFPRVTVLSSNAAAIDAHVGVYPPQHDSNLLISAMAEGGSLSGRAVLDLCCGSGVVAIAAARLGALSVLAFDICPDAVRCTKANVRAAGVAVEAKCGDHANAAADGPYELVVCNPLYVPTVPGDDHLPEHVGPAWAWDAGGDGRMVLDPLCAATPDLLRPGGTLLVVQSEFANPRASLRRLRFGGLRADVIAVQRIPFGPVMSARACRYESCGVIPLGRRDEQLVVIRADKP